jgi:lipopolysaccharide export system permease protein
MRTVRRLFYRDIVSSVTFVALAFLSLFFFIDFVDDLDDIGKRGRAAWHVALGALYAVPGHFYELFPIAVLIGTIFSLARMAQSSEYTILRTGGLGPGRALGMLAWLGVAFGALNFVVGDYVSPVAERAAVLLRAQFNGGLAIGGAGAWLKERRRTPEGERSYSVNIAATAATGVLQGVRIFEFDADGALVQRIAARQAQVGTDGVWTLSEAEVTRWPPAGQSPGTSVSVQRVPSLAWPSTLDAGTVASAVLPLNTMSTVELWRYGEHLEDQEQASQQVEIRFWKKALYPLACLVMLALALPFAYLRARAGSVSLKVFGGIMLGISFVLLNNLAGHIGLLRAWTPWVVAAMPSLLYFLMSMAAFTWLVRYR